MTEMRQSSYGFGLLQKGKNMIPQRISVIQSGPNVTAKWLAHSFLDLRSGTLVRTNFIKQTSQRGFSSF